LPTRRRLINDGVVENADTLASRKRHSSSIMEREAMRCMMVGAIFEDEVQVRNNIMDEKVFNLRPSFIAKEQSTAKVLPYTSSKVTAQ
jgi:hypothetical protein